MLHFIFGTSGTGKTTYAKKILIDLQQNGNKKLLMLVPEQSSFQTESDFLDILGPKNCRDILVFGFSRLCNYVFSNTGNIKDNVIDDGVRSIIMSKTIDEVSDSLTLFKSKNTRKSTLELMIHSLKECKKDNISADMLLEAASFVNEETLQMKLKETSIVLDAYDAIISQTYIDPLDNLNRLKEILLGTNIFNDYNIVVDSFSGFTYQQLEIIEVLLKQSKDMYVTLNLDIDNNYLDYFKTTNDTRKAIKLIAEKNNIQIAPFIKLEEMHRFENDALKFLSRNIFRFSDNIYNEKTDSIHTFIADTIYSEVDFVAQKIKRLVIEDGYCYKDIAIITRDISKYRGVLDTCLEKYEIPFFMDMPNNIFTRPIVRFICSAIDFINNGFDREYLLSMLKTGLTGLKETEIANFENYLFIWNLDRKDLRNKFVNNPSGFEKVTDKDIEFLNELEAIRNRIIVPLEKFESSCKNTTGIEISKALYNLLEDFNINKTIVEFYDKLESKGLVFEAKEEIRIYNLLMESLDKIVAVIGEDYIDLKKYKEYFDYKLQDLSISDIPRYQDQISVATADRVRLNSSKVVFIIGVIENIFPSIPVTTGVFTENERRLLISKLPLTDSLEDLACHEKYLAYCVLTSPSQELFVTSYSTDFAGKVYNPSEILVEIAQLFPNRQTALLADINEFDEIWSEKQAFQLLARNIHLNNTKVASLKQYFNLSSYASLLESITSYMAKAPKKVKDINVAEELFSKNMRISASQLEVFDLCPFQYFCSYGLKAKERRKVTIDSMQFGNVVHYFMEVFLKTHSKEALNSLTDEDIIKSIDDILLEYANENFGGLADKSNSFLNLYERLKKNIFNLIKEVIKQLSSCDYVPVDFELPINNNEGIPEYVVNIDEEKTVSVRGFVDRVDTMKKSDDELFVRIVDYKTGNKEFKLSEILYGINMQMLIYLKAVISNGQQYYGKKLIPTGILYMPSSTNEISVDTTVTTDSISKDLEKNFMMNGLLLDDSRVLEGNGNYIKSKRKSKDSLFSENLADVTQFNCIFKHIDNTIIKMGEELLKGNISPNPIKGIKDGCAYCPYDSVCGHTMGDSYKYREKKSADDVYKELGMEVEICNE